MVLHSAHLSEPPAAPTSVLLCRSLCCTTGLPRTQDQIDDVIHIDPILDLRKDGGAALPHLPCVPLHDVQIRTYRPCQIRLVHHQQIALRDPRSTFPRDLVAAAHIDDVDDEIGQLARVVCRQVVAAGLDEEQLRGVLAVEILERGEVRRNVLSHGGVRAAAGLYGAETRGRQRGVAQEELAVFAREDVVGHGGDGVFVAEGEAEG